MSDHIADAKEMVEPSVRSCTVCGCTETDCSGCIERTGRPCYWTGPRICSACSDPLDEMLLSENEMDLDDACPHCDGTGQVWGCAEDTCVCTDDDGLGCNPGVCDYCEGEG